jgi:hypothetical protein
MRTFLLVLFIFTTSLLTAQEQHAVNIRFVTSFHGKVVHTSEDSLMTFPDSDMAFETLRYYISGVSFYMDGRRVFSEDNSYHLIDAAAAEKSGFSVHVGQPIRFDEVRFNLGIDSVTNTAGVIGGDLDPTTGMYWTWQSGYINFKLEGISKSCPARKNRFQFHLGGYAGANNSLQQVSLKVKNSKNIKVGLPLDKFLQEIDLANQHTVMNPCGEAVVLSGKLASLFEILP